MGVKRISRNLGLKQIPILSLEALLIPYSLKHGRSKIKNVRQTLPDCRCVGIPLSDPIATPYSSSES